jgi:hypothetical protein
MAPTLQRYRTTVIAEGGGDRGREDAPETRARRIARAVDPLG